MTKPTDKQPDPPNLAPWVHPKSKKWFKELFDESGLVMGLRDVLENLEQPVGPAEARILMMMVATLGTDGVWPEGQRKELQRIVMSLARLSRAKDSDSSTPINIEEHQRREAIGKEVEIEIELLRRMVGISNRVTDLHLPESWGAFWT